MKKILKASSILCLLTSVANASPHHAVAMNHAPIGVMADHRHDEGEIMFSYRFAEMTMNDLYQGDSQVSFGDVSGYMMLPTEMTMQMHMFGFMYGISDDTTLMISAAYKDIDMKMKAVMSGMVSEMKSDGVTDVKLALLSKISDTENKQFHITYGVSLPTGSISESSGGTRLPYKMQIGSGTLDPLVGLTHITNYGDFQIGAQANAVFRLGRNKYDYSLGEQYSATFWGAKSLSDAISLSARVRYEHITTIDGEDSDIESMMAPVRDADMQGGEMVAASLGVNYLFMSGSLKGNRLALELESPLYHNVEGTQLGQSDVKIIAGWQAIF